MQKLNPNYISKAKDYINSRCRPLEKARFGFLFGSKNPDEYLKQLKLFRNPDGGFGNGLEPDILLPDSSPLATTLAFQFLAEIPNVDEETIKRAISYFERSFNKQRMGWYAISEKVNDYPHAVWWNWDTEKKMTSIDEFWGNPSAEIIGYLSKYRQFLTSLNINNLIDHAISYWTNKKDFFSEHEIYCFMKFHNNLPKDKAQNLESNLVKATQKLVVFDSKKWTGYTPRPLNFAENPNSFLFETVKENIDVNLDYLISTIKEDGIWSPNWNWRQYESEWEKSKTKWEGVLTIQNLKILFAYGRIESN